MRTFSTLLVSGGMLLASSAVQAQASFGMGARLGLNVSTAPFKDAERTYSTSVRAGVEAGFAFDVSFGRFAVQPALLFSQKGFTIDDSYTSAYGSGSNYTATLKEEFRLNYITIPVNFAVALHEDGQGLQFFAGPYFGVLLGGNYNYDDRFQSTYSGATTNSTHKVSGDVSSGDYYSSSSSDTKFYSRSFDAGLQAGLGYRKNGFLVQAGYSRGLSNVGADYKFTAYGQTKTSAGPTYYNRVFQLSISYLVGSKS